MALYIFFNLLIMKYILLLFLVSFISCNQDNVKGTSIIIDANESFDISNNLLFNFIQLETTDTNLFGDIGNILIYQDKIYIIDSKSTKLLVFNMEGKFITQIGSRGNGPGEYVLPIVMHINDKKHIISVGDPNLCKLLNYNIDDYQYINSQRTEYFTECFWLPDGNIAWMFPMGYTSESRESFLIKITDSNLKELSLLFPISNKFRYLMSAGSCFYTYNDKCILNLPYDPTVYQISSKEVVPYYNLDILKYQFPSKDWLQQNAVQNYSAAVLKSEYISACNVKENDDYLSVNYFAKGNNGFLGFYNKKTKKSILYSGSEFINQTGLTGASWVKGVYKDYFIISLSASALKRHGSKIPELKHLSKKVKEDDNPVLCLFKFK